jgi:hypothetical protein
MSFGRRALGWVAAATGGAVLGLALRLLTFVVAAHGVRLAGALCASLLTSSPEFDPVYTQAALRGLADLHLQGLAVAGAPGEWLHAQLPGVFGVASRAYWSPLRVAIQPGSPVLARLVDLTGSSGGVACCDVADTRTRGAPPRDPRPGGDR